MRGHPKEIYDPLTIVADLPDFSGRRTPRRSNPIPVCSQINNCGRDLLWTTPFWPVDGLRGQLRGFRKSHQLSFGRLRSDPRSGDCSRRRRTSSRRAVLRVRIRRIQKQGRDGMSLLEGIIDSRNNPLAAVEDIAAENNWAFERSGEDEVTIVSKGSWTDYQLSFTWMAEIEALHLACAFDMKIPQARLAEVQRLIAAINEQLWVGHFDLSTHTTILIHLHPLFLPNRLTSSTAQCYAIL